MGGGAGGQKREGEGSFKTEKNRASSFCGFFDKSDGRWGCMMPWNGGGGRKGGGQGLTFVTDEVSSEDWR